MDTLKRWLQAFIRAVQKVLLVVLLTLLYWSGFACTWIFLALFDRRFLRVGQRGEGGRWQEAVGYNLDECNRPS